MIRLTLIQLRRKSSYAQATPRRRASTFNPYAPIGQSQETPRDTATRREREAIQRSHRLINRAGGPRSQTPSFSELLQRQLGEPELPTPTPSTYFLCEICTLPRPVGVRSVAEGVCVYCQQPSQAPNPALELLWCILNSHEVPRHGFTRPDTGIESHRMCNPCFFEALGQDQDNENDDDSVDTPCSRSSSVSSFYPLSRRGSAVSELGRLNMSPSPMFRANSPAPPRILDTTDPHIDTNIANNDPDAPARSEQDWKYMFNFQASLAKDVMEYCSRCKESWFNTGVQNEVCKKCRSTRDKSKKDDEPFLMDAENLMDPGVVPLNLPISS
jgi:hypothetical protein